MKNHSSPIYCKCYHKLMGNEGDRLLSKYDRVMAGERTPKELVDFEKETMQKLREQEKLNQPQDNSGQAGEKKTST